MIKHLQRGEATAAALLTLAGVWLHTIAATSAGALWRDEANTIGLATLPTLSEVWRNLQYDSFPLAWILLVRAMAGLFGPMNDAAFRAIGFAIGLSVLASLWFVARTFGNRVPLLSLALLALSPSVIRWGDSLRGYGLGIALMLIACALIWRFVANPGRRTFAVATVAAVLSVQTLFYNAPALLAFCAGAVGVCAMSRAWKKAGAVIGIGAVAALSLVPYAATIRAASSWNYLVQIPQYNLEWFFMKLDEAISPAGPWATEVWFAAFLLAVFAGSLATLNSHRFGLSTRQREIALFGVVTLAVGVVAQMCFLFVLSYATQVWYYLTLLAVAAVCMDILSGALMTTPGVRLARLAAVMFIGASSVVYARSEVNRRMTNVDIVASQLEKSAAPGDLIVVSMWYIGVSFARYYGGAAEWIMLPPFEFHRFQRFDLLQAPMLEADQRAPAERVIRRVESVLRAGKSVFIVGEIPASNPDVGLLPPARLPEDGWRWRLYQRQWRSLLGQHIRLHSAKLLPVPSDGSVRISVYEHLPLTVATGWRE